MIAPRTLHFLGQTIDIDREGWSAPARSALAQYNLHYFDCARHDGGPGHAAWCAALIEDWIAANPPGTPVAWDPYPVSLRLVNWIKSSLRSGALDPAVAASIGHQARWLAANLERDIRANHLFANGKALLFAGLALEGSESALWRDLGYKIVRTEAAEQQLADGAHFERSPMYHALFTEDLLDIANLARRAGDSALADEMSARAARALTWLETMSHPDGGIAFFNDAAFGIAPASTALVSYARELGVASPRTPMIGRWLDSGYVRLESARAVLLADIAPAGPDYQPGHSHADTLSFELSVGNQRIVVNSGTSVYGTGAERQRQRGTAAHSTLELDGADSSEVWAGFRLGRRARARARDVASGRATGWHDGYRFLDGKPVHTRRWTLKDDGLEIEDDVSGAGQHAWQAVVRFHLHPEIAVSLCDGCIRLVAPDGSTMDVTADRPITIGTGTWHPHFGENVANRHLALAWRAAPGDTACRTRFAWSGAG